MHFLYQCAYSPFRSKQERELSMHTERRRFGNKWNVLPFRLDKMSSPLPCSIIYLLDRDYVTFAIVYYKIANMNSFQFESINFTSKYVAVKNVVRNFSQPLTTRHFKPLGTSISILLDLCTKKGGFGH